MTRENEEGWFQRLTPREREVLTLLRLGLTDGQIAERSANSQSGASYHVSQIIGKLGVRDRYEAAAWPDPPPWWAKASAPLVMVWRRVSAVVPFAGEQLGTAVMLGIALALLSGVGLMAALLVRANTGDDDSAPPAGARTKPADSATFLAVQELQTPAGSLAPTPARTRAGSASPVSGSTAQPTGGIRGRVISLDPQTALGTGLVLVIPVGLAQPVDLNQYALGDDPDRFMQLGSSREGPGLVATGAQGAYSVTSLAAGEYLVATDASLANGVPLPEVIEISIDGRVSTMPAFRARVGDGVTTVDFAFGTPRTGPSRIKVCITTYDPETLVGGRDVITQLELQPAHPEITVELIGDGCVQLENVPAGHYSISLTTARGFTPTYETDVGPGEDGQINFGVAPPAP